MIHKINSITDAVPLLSDTDAAVFDLDDTLYPEKDYVRSGFCAVAGIFPQVPDMADRLWSVFLKGIPAIDEVLAEYGLSEHKDTALMAYRAHRPVISMYPEAVKLLRALKHTKKLGLITDGRPDGQRAKIDALGLYDIFDEIIITDELGGQEYRKPSPKAYELMQERMGVPYERMAYIGDNIKKDFISPENLGMQSIWFCNRDGLYYEDDE